MSEMIERVARAMFDAEWRDSKAEEAFPGKAEQNWTSWKRKYLVKARAAIEALREPTPEMSKAAWSKYEQGHIKTAWRLMIDVALTGSQ